jgi:hypothetical protein
MSDKMNGVIGAGIGFAERMRMAPGRLKQLSMKKEEK